MRWWFGGESFMARLIIERDAFGLVGSGDSSQSSAASFACWSVSSLPRMSTWPGTQGFVTFPLLVHRSCLMVPVPADSF